MIDPGGTDDPRAHIRFRLEHAVSQTDAGRRTIDVLALNRPELLDARRRHLTRLRELQGLQEVVQRLDADGLKPDVIELRERARRELARAPSPSAIFSAMAADFLHGHGVGGAEAL